MQAVHVCWMSKDTEAGHVLGTTRNALSLGFLPIFLAETRRPVLPGVGSQGCDWTA